MKNYRYYLRLGYVFEMHVGRDKDGREGHWGWAVKSDKGIKTRPIVECCSVYYCRCQYRPTPQVAFEQALERLQAYYMRKAVEVDQAMSEGVTL